MESADRVKSINAINVLGIEFAPLNIPWQRRIEVMVTTFFFTFMMLGLFVFPPLFLYLLFTQYWYVTVIYTAWIYYDRETAYKGGRKLQALRNSWFWQYLKKYFPINFVKTVDLPADENYMFVCYPHGVICVSFLTNFQSNVNKFDELFPGIDTRIMVLNANFRIPLCRELYLSFGGIAATENSLMYNLCGKNGRSCLVLPGGAAEALKSVPGPYNIILNCRKGFVRIALKSGSPLVPVFSFGENEIYNQIQGPFLNWLQDRVRNFWGAAPCLLLGRGMFQYSFGMLPHRKTITTVVGKPIIVPRTENPSKELINEYHEKFVCELQALFNEYKGKYDPRGNDAILNIL